MAAKGMRSFFFSFFRNSHTIPVTVNSLSVESQAGAHHLFGVLRTMLRSISAQGRSLCGPLKAGRPASRWRLPKRDRGLS